MSRLLVPSEPNWYEELNSVAYYGETEFENRIKQYLEEIFPDFYAFPFKRDFEFNGTIKRPDLALLKKDYTDWWIIETELASHELSHVKPQVEVFINGDYNSYLTSTYIHKQIYKYYNEQLNVEDIRNLIIDRSPNVMVIVDEEKKDWEFELTSLGVNLCILQTYKAINGNQAYRLEGDYPIIEIDRSHCRYHKFLSNTLEIVNTNIFFDLNEPSIEISFNSRLTQWVIIDMDKKDNIRFIGALNPIPPNNEFVIIKDTQNKFYIKKV